MLRNLIIVFALSGCVLNKKIKEEGSRCRWKGLRGTCVKYYRCLSTMDHVNNSTYPPTCSYKDGINIVCCTDCDVVPDTRKIIYNKDLGTLDLVGPRALDECVLHVNKLKYPCKGQYTSEILTHYHATIKCYTFGESLNGFITQSPTLPPRKETYMALLGYGDEVKDAKWPCAGGIISEKYIITAAHCVSDSSLGSVKYVAVDIVSRTRPAELWTIYDVERTIPHPEYKPPSKYHDIALVETKKKITFSEAVLPACLQTQIDSNLDSTGEAIVRSSTKRNPGFLLPTKVVKFDETQCSLLYPAQDSLPNGFDNMTQACFGNNEKPDDSCQSDSGSPLLARYLEVSWCAPVISGVTSIDRICGSSGSSGLYTSVVHYLPWIENIVWPLYTEIIKDEPTTTEPQVNETTTRT